VDEIRRRKVEEQLREELASLILGGEVKDPRVGSLTSITRVEVARDMSYARVYVSTFGIETAAEGAGFAEPSRGGIASQAGKASPDTTSEASPASTAPASARLAEGHGDELAGQYRAHSVDGAVEGLTRAAGFLQSRLAKRVRMRLTPKLIFVADRGIKEGFELNEKIKGLFQ
jgi:ribosome-binding factor A